MKALFERTTQAVLWSLAVLTLCLASLADVPAQERELIVDVPMENIELGPPIPMIKRNRFFPYVTADGQTTMAPENFTPMAVDPAAIYTNLNPTAFTGVVFLNAGQVGGVTRLVADDLTLTGTPPHNLGWVQWTICNNNAATVTVRSLIRLYADNAGVPGNLFAGYNIAPFIGVPTNSCQPVSLRLPLVLQTTAPSGKIWAGITFDNADGATATATQMNGIGQGYFNPPESGSSADQFFLTTTAGDFLVNNPAGSVTTNAGGPVDNFGWDIRRRAVLNPITRLDSDPRPPGGTARWSITLNTSNPAEATQLTGLTAANFSLVPTGGASGTITSFVANGAGNNSWTVTATLGAGTGTIGLNFVTDAGLGTGVANNVPTVGQVYNVGAAPTPTPTPVPTPTPPFAPPAILFVSNRDGNNEIYRMNADGTDQRRMTNTAESEPLAKWSPSGTKIAFLRVLSPTNSQMWTMNADGTNQTLVSDADGIHRIWGWSPDGGRILYAKKGTGNSFPLWTMNPDGTGKLQITTPGDLEDHNARYSPNGSMIVFGRCVLPAVVCDVWTAGSDGSNPTNLTAGSAGDDDVPKFTRDGKRIVFARSNDAVTIYNTWVMNADGSGAVPLTNVAEGVSAIAGDISPTGSNVLMDHRGATGPTFEIYTANFESGNVVNVTNNAVRDENALWSPNGGKIAFRSRRDAPTDEIYTMNADGTEVVRLTNNTSLDFLTDWHRSPWLSTASDFDGDNMADLGVYRPDDANWYVYGTKDGAVSTNWGNFNDRIVPADYDGDGVTDYAIYRDGFWWLKQSTAGVIVIHWGDSGDIPVPGDYDGDGKADIAIFRAGVWWLYQSRDGIVTVNWGNASDTPVPADYDGDGRTDFAVVSNGVWWVYQSRDGVLGANWGNSTDKPVPADYDGDGKADFAVVRDGVWWIYQSRDGVLGVNWGSSTDIPVPADYDGDGKADIATFSDGQWWIYQSTEGVLGAVWGYGTDKPTAHRQ